METESDLRAADRETLIGIIARQQARIVQPQAIIERLEKRVAQLQGQVKTGGSRGMPGLKPKGDPKPVQPKQPRKARRHGVARVRMTPTSG